MGKFFGQIWKLLKDKWPLLLISTSIVLGCWVAVFFHYAEQQSGSGIIGRMEAMLFDFRLKMRGVQKPKNKVVIIAVDEKSIQQFNAGPL